MVKMEPLVNRRIAREKIANALAIETAGAPDQPMHFVIRPAQKEISKIRPVLPSDAGDQCAFHEELSLWMDARRRSLSLGSAMDRPAPRGSGDNSQPSHPMQPTRPSSERRSQAGQC
jgi:hypothetical protein